MLNFFTKLLTPIFIGIGLISPSVEIPPQELISTSEIITNETRLIQEKTTEQLKIKNLEKEIKELKQEKEVEKTKVVKPVVKKIIEKAYTDPVVIIPEEVILLKEVVEDVSIIVKTDGECGTSSSLILEEGFDQDILCSIGKLTDLEKQDGELEYICEGLDNDSTNAKCFAYYVVSGECADIEDESISYLEESNACKNGVLSHFEIKKVETRDTKTGNNSSYHQYYFNHYKYSCSGINGGATSDCSVQTKELDNYVDVCNPSGGGRYFTSCA
jgi:hypothetical protein